MPQQEPSSGFWLLIIAAPLRQCCLDDPVTSVMGTRGNLPRWGKRRRVAHGSLSKTSVIRHFSLIGTRYALTTEHVSNATCVTLFSMSSVGRGSCPENLNLLNVSHQIRHRMRFASDPQRFAEVGASALQRDGKPGRSQLGLRLW